MEFISCRLSFLTIIFPILLCPIHRIIFVALIALDELTQVYKTDAAAQLCTTPEQHIFTLPPLLPLTDDYASTVKSIMSITITTIVMVATIDILICI